MHKTPCKWLKWLPILAAAGTLAGCGPKQLKVDPRAVVDVQVRPASGQPLYCPGDAFEVELVAKMKDGSTCSSIDPTRRCGGVEGVISRDLVRIQSSSGDWRNPGWTGDSPYVLVPPDDALATAEQGLRLRAWLEGPTPEGARVKSMEGTNELRPVYTCAAQRERLFSGPSPKLHGENGAPGPSLTVAVTTLSTPYYPNAALVVIKGGGETRYLISPSADQPVTIVSRGAPGFQGKPGSPGKPGENGRDSGLECVKGLDGTNGGPGGPGGPGGNGGPGGAITLLLDSAAADRLRSRVVLKSEGGAAGAPGPGGPGGVGGTGGRGLVGVACTESGAPKARDGASGQRGPDGPSGQAGPPGPAPVVDGTQAREALFRVELPTIQRIEAAKGKK
jgi:hypothetical protein